MRHLKVQWISSRITAGCFIALAAGCSSLEIDVDVYKGPLTHERHIQVRQYASMAAAAKPLIRDMFEKIDGSDSPPACGDAPVDPSKISSKRARFLCEILQLYVTVVPVETISTSTQLSSESTRALPTKSLSSQTQSQRPTSRNPELGLDKLTFAVAQAMAQASGRGPGPDPETNTAVDRLSEALILFAQKLVYVSNHELMFGDGEVSEQGKAIAAEEKKQWEKVISILQTLGNTILVHANDLRRQTERDVLHADRSTSLSDAVQQAFQPEPSATVNAILHRLQHFSLDPSRSEKDVEALDTATPQQRKIVEDNENLLKQLQVDAAPLLAAHCTLFKQVPPVLMELEKCSTDEASLTSDLEAIQGRYTGPLAARMDGLQGLNDWLSIQTAQGAVPNTNRMARLTAFKSYLFIEEGRLQAAGITDKTSRADAMKVLEAYLKSNMDDACKTAMKYVQAKSNVKAVVDEQNKQEARRLADLAKLAAASSEKEVRDKTTKVVRTYRSTVIAEAEALGTRDPEVINAMLLRQIRQAKESASTAKASGPTSEELVLTLAIVEKFSMPRTPCHVSVYSAQCKGRTTIEVLDKLIAALRAQHVQAVAAGNEVAAVNLLKAVNAAYDQRTAMIYLRPASDYLRSVYASTTLQDGAEDQYRNMLAGWLKNLQGNFSRSQEAREKIEAKRELDKINWQNVNKVTLSGGGFTNYVIAKDDVGNWYVKAYGSDPEAIVKSATSLALFNAGKGVNVNLLRRVDVQRRLDEDKSLSDSERAALQKEMGPLNPASGQALMKVRDRFATRYSQDTLMQANALLATMKEIPSKASVRIAEVGGWPGGECTPASADSLLKPLEGKHLTTPRDRLAATVAQAATPAKVTAALLVQSEQDIQAGLIAMHQYASDVQRSLKHGKDAACEAAEQLAAKLVRDDIRAQVVSAAIARRSSIERYEDALTGVLDIASQE